MEESLDEHYETVPLVGLGPDDREFVSLSPSTPELYSAEDVATLCKVVWGEARGCSTEEQMLVVWCVLNRVDAWSSTIQEVVTAPNQFTGYSINHPVELEIEHVVVTVLEQWARGESALVHEPFATSSEYLFFYGDGEHNWFREVY